MDANKKLKNAKVFGIVSLCVTILMIAELILTWRFRYEGSVEVFHTLLGICPFLWLFVCPAVSGLAIAGLVLSSGILHAQPRAKVPLGICIITIAAQAAGLIVYFLLMGSAV